MYLSTDLLTDPERARAFETVPARHRLRQSATIVGSLIKNGGAELAEVATSPGYVRYGLVALFDGLRLAHRACAETMESKAADLVLARSTPRTFVDESQPTLDEAVGMLRRSLIEMPLHLAAAYVDAAVGHLGNAAVRLAVEVNCASGDEMKALGLSGDPAADNDWLPPPSILLARIEEASKAGLAAQLPYFRLVRRWRLCMENADVQWTLKYRQGITHSDVPVTGWPGGPTRSGELGLRRMQFPKAVTFDPTTFDEIRRHIADGLGAIGDLAVEAEAFVVQWLRRIGFEVVIREDTVSLSSKLDGLKNITVDDHYVVVDFDPDAKRFIEPRQQRDPGPFIET